MKNALNKQEIGAASVSLQVLVNQLVDNLPETLALNKIIVENEVTPGFKIQADQRLVTPVIDELLTAIIMNARDTSILITAEKFTDTVILSFEDPNNYNGYALSFSLMSVEQHAKRIGGYINIQGVQKRVANVSFGFPDTLQGNKLINRSGSL